MLYHAYQSCQDALSPLRLAAQQLGAWLWLPDTEGTMLRHTAASAQVLSRLRLTHRRPDYGIDQIQTAQGEALPVEQTAVLTLPFATLLRFRAAHPQPGERPPVLLAAPLSGHFATLLRDTVRTLLQDHEVYVTDWHNARDVPLHHGRFGLDDYIDYMMRFIDTIGAGVHVVAVCQPCVAALAATALMAEDDHPHQPRSLTLMAGPIDCRINPTEVNRMATSRPIDWFERHLISHVPWPHAGHLRRVYPGFLQLSAFMSMNPERHRDSFLQMHAHLLHGRQDEAQAIGDFYDEYLAVNDLPADFYLETVERVFQTYDLPRGTLQWRNRTVDTAAIRRTALMTVEGERDDICAVGQTVAAQDLCRSVRPYRKTHHIQTGVGHYGVFSGRRWNQQIYPRLRDHVHASIG